jgi:hypothetical protein
MDMDMDKENIAEGLDISSALKPSLSARSSNRKSRSKSIGPGGTAIETGAPLKEDHGNRRKVGSSSEKCIRPFLTPNSLHLYLLPSPFFPERRIPNAEKRVASLWVS